MPTTRTTTTPTTAGSVLLPVPIAILLPAVGDRYVPAPTATSDPVGLVASTAAQLVRTYTRMGDLVVDVHGTGVVAAAAARLGRHATTLVADRDLGQQVQDTVEARLDPTRRALARTLTVATADIPDRLSAAPGRVRLLLTRLPATGRRLSLRTAVHWLAACRDALTEPGYAIVAVDATGPGGRFADHATTVNVAARAGGLIYHQQLIVPTRPLAEPDDPDQFPAPLEPGQRHTRVHADLYVFATHEGDLAIACGGERDV